MRDDHGAPALAGAVSPTEAGAPYGLALGATLLPEHRCSFRVWAPFHDRLELHITALRERRVPMTKSADGYFETTVDDCPPGTRYLYRLDNGDERPDPASRLQPDGVHKASAIVARDFSWGDRNWRGIPLEDTVAYELHVGTFTKEGTFDGAISRLDHLRDLGITAVELLPIAQFPGTRNWGYDGAFVGAVQESYGGPAGLKRFVGACHQRGLAVILDVVYNHLGPEGNYLGQFGPYFTDRYKTPWGLALNFDGPQSDHVRWFFIHNALQWVDEFRIDALRVDAVHAIVDHSAEPFLQDMTTAVRDRASQLGRKIYTIAESDLNDPRVITARNDLGLGFDSQWNDDFHHSLHVLMTGEQEGYYEGFGKVSDFARVFQRGYLYVGQHSTYRGRKYGCLPKTREGKQFVVFAQNHDQVGNRMMGDRLSALVSPEQLRLIAAVVSLAPFIPMLFMGEEYGEKAPFQYFTSHGDADLIEAVRKGRKDEFDDFKSWAGEPPDPHAQETFERSKLDWSLLEREEHASLRNLYRDLFRLRRETPSLRNLNLGDVRTDSDDERKTLIVHRGDIVLVFNFSDARQVVETPASTLLLETGATVSDGNVILAPYGFAILARK